MKNLTLIRHADANPQLTLQCDKDRNLTDIGQHQVDSIAKQLKKITCFPDYLLCSSAKRAIQTSKILCQKLKINSSCIELNTNLYSGDLDDILSILYSAPSSSQQLFLIGHNPNLSCLAHKFCSTTKPIILPTAGVISLDFNIENWNELLSVQGKLLFFIEPLHE